MRYTYSPMRYPGGKACIYDAVTDIIRKNNLRDISYVEPYVGGAGLALSLLINGNVEEIYINDLDRSIYSVWYCILNRTDEFINAIQDIPVTIDEWHLQRLIQLDKETVDIFELGLSTFYLNRTNRSGIIKGGVIGGQNQDGNYLLDCRFNKNNLIKRIRQVAEFSEHIHLYNLDAIEFVNQVRENLNNDTLIYFDPPYYKQGQSLYTNYYKHDDHVHLGQFINGLNDLNWIVTYDNSEEIYEIYKENNIIEYSLRYSAKRKYAGIEYMISNLNLG